jgi:hypothetical protein
MKNIVDTVDSNPQLTNSDCLRGQQHKILPFRMVVIM